MAENRYKNKNRIHFMKNELFGYLNLNETGGFVNYLKRCGY